MKYALVIGNTVYNDSKLAQLKTPAADSRALANVLGDKKIGGFDEVTPLINQTETEIRRAVSSFLENKKPDDLVLVYFSGHGVLDDSGRLYLASKDTQTNILRATAIPSTFISGEMDSCRSKRQILILDCCHSGAFARGTKAGKQKAVTETTFEGNGFGRVVLTASDSTQFALEGNRVIKQTNLSLFTHFLLEGLKTGNADVNNDGYISLDEWYDYTYTQVLSTTPKQVPHKWSYRQQGDLIVARNPHYELIQREAAEKAAREEAERIRQEKERKEREAAEMEKVINERVERETTQRLAQEKAKRDEIEKTKQNQAEHQVARRAKFVNLFSKATLANKIIIVLGVLIGLFVAGSWGTNLFSLMSTGTPGAIITPIPPTQTFTPTPTIIYQFTWTPRPTSTITMTPTATLTLTPIPQQSILLQEDFEDNKVDSRWFSWQPGMAKAKGPDWTIQQEPDGNRYASASGLVDTLGIWYGDKNLKWIDYAFETRIKFANGTTLEIYNHANAGRAQYTVYVGLSGGIDFAQYNELNKYGFTGLGAITSKAFNRYKWYTIRVEIKGDLLSVYVDNSLVGTKILPTPLINTQGGIGYSVRGEKIYLDDIKVWQLK